MQISDYVIIGIVVIGALIGFFKKFCKSLFDLIGIAAVTIGTAYLSRFPMQWFGFISSVAWRACAALAATLIVVSVVYAVVAHFLKKPFLKIKFPSVISRIFGMLIGIVSVYAVIAVVVTVLLNVDISLVVKVRELLGNQLTDSWIINNVYANNFFGDWLLKLFVRGLIA
ncbi:MAG: CvpA family protein [Corallococcus sp.]|nr:CvpA family protein [Corallococcus sp.]MCM1359187.1 CvpA family protein [Corallococcus sp.]MCM1394577.1 CvpA family protein [Corallococcus sp.]